MGKVEEEQSLPTQAVGQQNAEANAVNSRCCRCCGGIRGWVSFRCVFALVFGVGVFISAVFLLPFFHHGKSEPPDPDSDSRFGGHDIVARFMLDKPDWFLEEYLLQLEDDVFDEINVAGTKVDIISFGTSPGSNRTTVIFTVDSDESSQISPATQSLVRASFESILVHQTPLRLTTASLFGDPLDFDVLKFKGGITVSPTQSAFLLQNQRFHFNFTLNFSIKEIQDNFGELRSQLISGLRLAQSENLYISLTNLRGSTVDPPTIVRSEVLLAVGINRSRMKQLAKTITGSRSKNLGLNNTVFGRVKQVSLSSNWTHFLGGDSGSPSPSPAPHPHHTHHHKDHPNPAPALSPPSRTVKKPPTPAPTLAPAPVPSPHVHKIPKGKPPACPFGPKGEPPSKKHQRNHMTPSVSPVYAPHTSPAPSPVEAPAPSPHEVPAPRSPPNVANAHAHPPSGSDSGAEPPNNNMRLVSHIPSSAASTIIRYSNLWAIPPFLLALHL